VIIGLKDLTSDAELVKTYFAVGLNAHRLKEYETVISNTEKALEIAKANSIEKVEDYSILVDAYDENGELDKAIALLEWQFEKYNQIDNYQECASCLAQIAIRYKVLEQNNLTLSKLELALDFAKIEGDTNFILTIQTFIAESLFDLERYVEAEKLNEKLINSFELLNNKKCLIDMKLLKYQIIWMTGGNKKDVLKWIRELSLEVTETDQESIDQRILLEKTIINCLEDIGGWEHIKAMDKCKKRLSDLEDLVLVDEKVEV
jgi:tetratricopeptide (TPR) repeat protein